MAENKNEPKNRTENAEEPAPRIVLIDTNCFLRIYQSPVLPLLGEVIVGHELLTLTILYNEFFNSQKLMREYAFLDLIIQSEDKSKVLLKLIPAVEEHVRQIMRDHRRYVDEILEKYCASRGISTKRLSNCDLELLATAIEMEALIATDEWPLAFVVDDLMRDLDEGYRIGIMTSVDILYLLEQAGKLSREERILTVKSWMQNAENLHRDWRSFYRKLFNENAPTL